LLLVQLPPDPVSHLAVPASALDDPVPGKPLFEDAFANFTPQSPAKVNTHNKTGGPLLLIAGGRDHTVPAAITTATRRLYHKFAIDH
jgi:hypothetical protein